LIILQHNGQINGATCPQPNYGADVIP
jgi:hypothetical protein